jgi:hypothetical protein
MQAQVKPFIEMILNARRGDPHSTNGFAGTKARSISVTREIDGRDRHMFSASVAARHYDGLFVPGFGFAASHYGLPLDRRARSPRSPRWRRRSPGSRRDDARPPDGSIGVAGRLDLLERDVSRHHDR